MYLCIYCSGAELGAQDEDGLTPLMLAAAKNCETTFNLMLISKDGAKLVRNTLLFLAQAQGQPKQISHLKSVSKQLQVG